MSDLYDRKKVKYDNWKGIFWFRRSQESECHEESEEGVAFSEVVVKQTADVEEYFKNLIRFEGYKVISEEYDESDMLMHYDELSIQANKLLFLESRDE